ncbi:hypothetical protein ACIPC1_02125 [Streptomyces sp. NPDC087263]
MVRAVVFTLGTLAEDAERSTAQLSALVDGDDAAILDSDHTQPR